MANVDNFSENKLITRYFKVFDGNDAQNIVLKLDW